MNRLFIEYEAGIASLGPNGGAFSLPGYSTVKVVADFALTETPDGTHGPIIGSSVAPGLVFGEGSNDGSAVQRRSERLRRLHHPQMARAQSRHTRRCHQNLHLILFLFKIPKKFFQLSSC